MPESNWIESRSSGQNTVTERHSSDTVKLQSDQCGLALSPIALPHSEQVRSIWFLKICSQSVREAGLFCSEFVRQRDRTSDREKVFSGGFLVSVGCDGRFSVLGEWFIRGRDMNLGNYVCTKIEHCSRKQIRPHLGSNISAFVGLLLNHMESPKDLSLPGVTPSPETLSAFWRKVAFLTARTKNRQGQWIGCPEVKVWNSSNMQKCDKCNASRKLKDCIIDDDQPSCRPCRTAKIACDRKIKYLFDNTCNEFFPTMDEFMFVFKTRDQQLCRSYQKAASRKRKASLPYNFSTFTGHIGRPNSMAIVGHTLAKHGATQIFRSAAYKTGGPDHVKGKGKGKDGKDKDTHQAILQDLSLLIEQMQDCVKELQAQKDQVRTRRWSQTGRLTLFMRRRLISRASPVESESAMGDPPHTSWQTRAGWIIAHTQRHGLCRAPDATCWSWNTRDHYPSKRRRRGSITAARHVVESWRFRSRI
ncbi:hypothetical protein C8R47DRAFT_1082733 [Mycena vitilis]|nr:hypothetical protein C8R47DRAFT_1082733 [Mycena vitilis]